MSFLYFAFKNPFRNKLRTFFVIFLLTIGLLSVITSMGFSGVTVESVETSINKGGADLSVSETGLLSTNDLSEIKGINGVQEAVGVSYYLANLDDNIQHSIVGFEGKELTRNVDIEGIGKIKLIDGKLFEYNKDEVLITKDISNMLNKRVGDYVTIKSLFINGPQESNSSNFSSVSSIELNPSQTGNTVVTNDKLPKNFKVVGIIEDIPQVDVIMPIQTANNILYNSSQLKFTMIAVKAEAGQLEKVKSSFNQEYPDLVVISGNEMANTWKNMLFYVTLFFVSVGSVIMMIATLKSVSERAREIGVLKAIGWSNKRIIVMILIESFVQLFIAWALIFILIITSMIILYFLGYMEHGIFNALEDKITMITNIITVSFMLSLFMPLLGAFLPLVRVIRLKPTEALKYE